MKNESVKKGLSAIIAPLFALYFIILAAERAASLIRSFRDPRLSPFGDAFGAYIYTLSILSLVGTAVLLVALAVLRFGKNKASARTLTLTASAAVGVLLFSGMVHTEYTVAPLQFAAYGALVLALVAKTALRNMAQPERPALRWLTLAYVVAFSMAVPVVYRAATIPARAAFHIIECTTSFVLVVAFTWLLCLMMTDGRTDRLLHPAIPLLSLCGNIPAILLWWQETPNLFVLIFLVLSTLLYLLCAAIARPWRNRA